MKTCEEYVLEELKAAKEKNEQLLQDNVELIKASDTMLKVYEVVKKHLWVYENEEDGRIFISMDEIYEESDKDDFVTLFAMLLNELEEKDEAEE